MTLDKDIYTLGETIKVTIRCDNSSCSKAVEAFKIKLLRNIQATSYDDDRLSNYNSITRHANHSKYISIFKEVEGVAAHETKDI